eukprot:scpid46499/ scgid18679/ 
MASSLLCASRQAQIPCVTEFVEDRHVDVKASRRKPTLPVGCSITILGRQTDVTVEVFDESTNSHRSELTDRESSASFFLLSPEARFDDRTFASVGDIMKLTDRDRPRYVIATVGWMSLEGHCTVDVGDVFRVDSRVVLTEHQRACAEWHRCAVGNTPCNLKTWSALDECAAHSAKLDFAVTCSFQAYDDQARFTLSDIERWVQDKTVTCPIRLQEVFECGDATISKGRKLAIPRTRSTNWLLLYLGEESLVATKSQFVRMSADTASDVMVKTVCREAQYKAIVSGIVYLASYTKLRSIEELKHAEEAPAVPRRPSHTDDKDQDEIDYEDCEELAKKNNIPRSAIPWRLPKPSSQAAQESTNTSVPYVECIQPPAPPYLSCLPMPDFSALGTPPHGDVSPQLPRKPHCNIPPVARKPETARSSMKKPRVSAPSANREASILPALNKRSTISSIPLNGVNVFNPTPPTPPETVGDLEYNYVDMTDGSIVDMPLERVSSGELEHRLRAGNLGHLADRVRRRRIDGRSISRMSSDELHSVLGIETQLDRMMIARLLQK